MENISNHVVEASELTEETFKFWFTDNQHIRSPFPVYIHQNLKDKSSVLFYQWLNNLKAEAKEELNDEAIAEKFEEIIFEHALQLIQTEDERITILYPFLPRLTDAIQNENGLESRITSRILKKVDDTTFLHLQCITEDTNEIWETSFELPA